MLAEPKTVVLSGEGLRLSFLKAERLSIRLEPQNGVKPHQRLVSCLFYSSSDESKCEI